MYYEGVNVYDRNAMNFGSLAVAIGEGSAIKYGNINALENDGRGGLWLGVDGGGLFHIAGGLGDMNAQVRSVR